MENPVKLPVIHEDKKEDNKMTDNNYDHHVYKYMELAKMDPAKKWVQYPGSLHMVREALGGEMKGKKILDIGCAEGTFSRMMAREGAEVIGYDPSAKEITEAQEKEIEENLGIKYFVADHPSIDLENKFDVATAILVLSLMENEQQLEQIFEYASKSLKSGGKFVVLTINPEFNRFANSEDDSILYNRRFKKTDKEKQFTLDFFDNDKNFKFSIKGMQFSKDDHRQAAIKVGFREEIVWKNMKVPQEAKIEMGEKFWEKFEGENRCPYIGMVACKQ